jgi:hypothetical protein
MLRDQAFFVHRLWDCTTTFVLGVGAFLLFVLNYRESGAHDTNPTCALTVSLIRGDGPFVDRFLPTWDVKPGGKLPDYLAPWRGHVVSRYPIAPALLALPVVALQVMYLDRYEPGWERRGTMRYVRQCLGMAKRAAALIVALTAVVLHRLLKGMGLGRVATPATLAAALGSSLWTVASQALWQHGPAALALTSAVWLLLPENPSRVRFALAGVAAAALVAFRLLDVVFALVIVAWVARIHPRRLIWFLPAPLLGAAALLGWNLSVFGAVTGGQAYLESLHPTTHALPAGAWSGDLLTGMAGTLFSPSRGLFIFSPWVGLALGTLPSSGGRLAPWPLIRWLLWALVPYGLLLSKYTVWWGGHCFGPRYWTDVMPLLAIVLACGLDWSYDRSRLIAMAFALTIVFSIGVQAVGAFSYASDWNLTPTNVDIHHERLWDWRDSQLSRCLIKGISW